MKFVKRVGLLLLLWLLLLLIHNSASTALIMPIDELVLIVESLILSTGSSRMLPRWSHGRLTIHVHIIHIVHRRMKRMSGVIVEIVVVNSVLLERIARQRCRIAAKRSTIQHTAVERLWHRVASIQRCRLRLHIFRLLVDIVVLFSTCQAHHAEDKASDDACGEATECCVECRGQLEKLTGCAAETRRLVKARWTVGIALNKQMREIINVNVKLKITAQPTEQLLRDVFCVFYIFCTHFTHVQ